MRVHEIQEVWHENTVLGTLGRVRIEDIGDIRNRDIATDRLARVYVTHATCVPETDATRDIGVTGPRCVEACYLFLYVTGIRGRARSCSGRRRGVEASVVGGARDRWPVHT